MFSPETEISYYNLFFPLDIAPVKVNAVPYTHFCNVYICKR